MHEVVSESWALLPAPESTHWEITHVLSGQLFCPVLMRRAKWAYAVEFMNILGLTSLGALCDRDMAEQGFLGEEALVLYREVEAACESLL